ncbi:MAG: DUF4115 domain-containing protein [Thermodesulfovibrio sp.]|nr:DUF4115 domain-containing protein [Thermodesulfovibrio sp.]
MYEEFKKRRLELQKSLEEIAEKTKIKKQCLQLIEEGRFDELPIEVYTRAYIKTYANILGVDPTQILKDYEEYLKTKKQNIQSVEPKYETQLKDEQKIESIKNFSGKKKASSIKLPAWSITAGIILVVIIILILFIKSEKKEHEIPPPVTEKIVSEKTKIQEKVGQIEQKENISSNQQNLKIEAIDKVWMRITLDDKERREFLLNPGQKVELQANKSFKLHIGNAGGVKVFFNNKEMGKLGEIGQVIYLTLPQDKN